MLKIFDIEQITEAPSSQVGGKAKALAAMAQQGINIPLTVCVPVDFYFQFVRRAGLLSKLRFELGRKDFADMRREEVWDCALRIRNHFLNSEMPKGIEKELNSKLAQIFENKKTAVRSSAPAEDSAGASFAGLHESYINVCGIREIIKHIKLVWASLWSDAALLYRQEIGLDIVNSSMAVVIQEVVAGEVSGVAFSQNPTKNGTSVIEAVPGLNQGLVDGLIEPDRWILTRETGEIEETYQAPKEFFLTMGENAVVKSPVPEKFLNQPVLEKPQVDAVYHQVMHCEAHFGIPQDMEWTLQKNEICVLQSRPITTLKSDEGDRSWYLGLSRSFENLQSLREKIEGQLIPQMIQDDADLEYDLSSESEDSIVKEIEKRSQTLEKWKKVYWDEFIPFAHGIRLFGQYYNDTIKPEDPYEFVQLLQNQSMLSTERNQIIAKMAELVSSDKELMQALADGVLPESPAMMQELKEDFDRLSGYEAGLVGDDKVLCHTVLQLAEHNQELPKAQGKDLEKSFFASIPEAQLAEAEAILDLGRCSYKLRDDDNIYLGRIEKQLFRAVERGEEILAQKPGNIKLKKLVDACRQEPDLHEHATRVNRAKNETDRQITGQPAGPGLVTGTARVVDAMEDLKSFQKGEVLVCDAIDPNMTFCITLAGGIIERRGGMLIHGAIIAREYGIPCVTGVPNAVDRIKTGDTVTVDGYLGIVTISKPGDIK